jgi:hypothetical protein
MPHIGLDAALKRDAREAFVVAHVEQVVDGDLLLTTGTVPISRSEGVGRLFPTGVLRLTDADRDALIAILTKQGEGR